MSLTFHKKLKFAEMVPTTVVLQLADCSVRSRVGVFFYPELYGSQELLLHKLQSQFAQAGPQNQLTSALKFVF